jgi:glutaredoxin
MRKKLFRFKFLAIFLLALFFVFSPNLSRAENVSHEIDILSSPTCPHCNSAKAFLSALQNDQKLELAINDYNISSNIAKAKELYEKHNLPQRYQGLVPVMFIADRYFVGFNEQIGEEIEQFILSLDTLPEIIELDDEIYPIVASSNTSTPLVEEPVVNENNIVSEPLLEDAVVKNSFINIPYLGEIDLKSYSLPALAITLGIVDGFNVCSLGALILILGLVIALRSRKRIFILGGSFLLATALVYGFMIFLWHRLFSFIAPYIRSLELLIGLLALAGGIYLLREFYKAYKSGPICSSNNILSRLSPKIEAVFKDKTNWWLLLGAVVLFASFVTIIEFPCSAFLPVLFTSILVESGVSQSTSLGYIALYMLFYLLDELVIFIIAVFTMKIKIVSPRFIIFFNLLAALIFLFLGFFYLAGLTL